MPERLLKSESLDAVTTSLESLCLSCFNGCLQPGHLQLTRVMSVDPAMLHSLDLTHCKSPLGSHLSQDKHVHMNCICNLAYPKNIPLFLLA
uniref:Uncharacterized protein n=1 Tax=Corvus moneduloides TaxID=1196302 RepID=A0A8C3EFF5_CORMO